MKSIKFTTIAVAVFIVLVLFSGTALAAFSGQGAGTTGDPYQITNVSQFEEIRNDLNKSFILINDIEITSASWTAVGNNSKPFNGTFDGNGKTITFESASGISFTKSGSSSYDGYGLFGQVKGPGKIQNLNIVVKNNITLTGNYTGVLVGYLNGTTSNISNSTVVGAEDVYILGKNYNSYIGGLVGYSNSGSIADSFADLDILLGTVSDSKHSYNGSNVGGFAGYAYSGNISNCYSSGSVVGFSNTAGGFIGNVSSVNITNCYSEGDVIGGYTAGGFAGYLTGGNLSKSYATGDVALDGTLGYAGGLIGEVSWGGNITECYASGDVSSTKSFVGGLIAYSFWGNISNCYASGSVSGSSDVGGLLGNFSVLSSGNVTNCYASGSVSSTSSSKGGLSGYGNNFTSSYYDKETTGQSDNKGSNRSTEDMMKSATFTNWDISSTDLSKIWYIYEGEDYPKLSALHQAETIYVGTTDQLTSVGSEIIKTDYENKKKTWTLDADYILDGNINMSGVSVDPIGTAAKPFTGTFTGSEDFTFAISDLTIDAPTGDNVGLFGYTENAVISNIHLENASVSGNQNVSLLIGCAAGNTEITQCSVTGTVNAAANHAGGFVGLLFEGNITQCYADADVTADSEAGGLVGAMGGGLISESYATGGITAETEVAGGLIAEYAGMGGLTIENSFALNEFIDSPDAAGRIIGVAEDDAVLTAVYAWDEMENALGNFDDGAGNGEEMTAADIWNTFDASVSPWECWSAGVWTLGTNEYFLLPVLIDVTDSIADASHLIPADDTGPGNPAKKSSGGSGTGSAKVVGSTEPAGPQASSGSTEIDSPMSNAPLSGTQGFETDIGEEKSSSKTLTGILAAGLIVVVLAVGLFIKGRKF